MGDVMQAQALKGEGPIAPEGITVFIRDVQIQHLLQYEGYISGAYRWLISVDTLKIPEPQDVSVRIDTYPENTSIELFWKLPDDDE